MYNIMSTPNNLRGLLRHPAFVSVLLLCIALLPRIFGLGRGLTTDEAYFWVGYRSADFLAALSEGRFADTMITGHPGVTTMWLGSIGLLVERALQGAGLLGSQLSFETHLILMRLPMAVVTALAVVPGYLLLRRVLGAAVALVAGLLWSSEPFLIAHSRLLHVDALLATLMLLAVLSLLAACFSQQGASRRPSQALLTLAGIVTGLALITKSLAVVLLPIGPLIILGWYWQRRSDGKAALFWLVAAAAVWGSVAMLAVFVAWPAMWVVPWQAISSVINEVIVNGGAPHPGTFLLGQHYITEEPGALYYPVTLFARLTPWAIVGLLALLVATLRRAALLRPYAMPLLLLTAAALLVPLVLTIPPKKFDRYALPAVPLLLTLAAVGLVWLGSRLPARPRHLAAALTAASASLTLLVFHPYYLAYYSPLIGGSLGAPTAVHIGWGEGLDQAADWLNQQPDLERGKVATWSPPTLAAYLNAPTTWQGSVQSGDASYLVIYLGQAQSRKESQYFGEVEAACTPVHTVRLRGIDYARIYRVPTFTPALAAPARFGDTLALSSSLLVPPVACSCQPYTLTLVFEPEQAPQQPLFLFVHVVGSDGSKLAQFDLPLESIVPPDAWQNNAEVPYTLQIPVPPDTPTDTYRIILGLYNPATGERLPVRPRDGSQPVQAGPHTLQAGQFEVLADQRQGCVAE